jgi:hypothetical protein
MPKRYWAKGLKRDKQFQVRMSAEEYKDFQRAAKEAKLSLVVYARHRILGIPIRAARQERNHKPALSTSSV